MLLQATCNPILPPQRIRDFFKSDIVFNGVPLRRRARGTMNRFYIAVPKRAVFNRNNTTWYGNGFRQPTVLKRGYANRNNAVRDVYGFQM